MLYLQVIGGIASAVADCLSLFSLFRFIAGAATVGCILVRFVYCMEIIEIRHRTAGGFVNNIFVSAGYAVLSLFAYLIRDWKYLMLAVSLPGLPLLLCWWWGYFEPNCFQGRSQLFGLLWAWLTAVGISFPHQDTEKCLFIILLIAHMTSMQWPANTVTLSLWWWLRC